MRLIKILTLIIILSAVSVLICQLGSVQRLRMNDAKWMWIQYILHQHPPTEVDYVFIGSSRTWCAIRSRQIEEAVPGVKVWNFGRHWVGRDIDYLLVEQLLNRHRVKHLFVEMIGQERFAPHQYAKYIVSPQAALTEGKYQIRHLQAKDFWTYSAILKERTKHLLGYGAELSTRLYRIGLEEIWNMMMPNPTLEMELVQNGQTAGFFVRDSGRKQKDAFVQAYGRFIPHFPVAKGPMLLPPGTYPDYYLQQLSDISERYDAKLSFLFLSDFAAVLPHDQMYHRFHQWGDVYFPNLRRLYKSELWRDKNHLYGVGSVILTEEVIAMIKAQRPLGPEVRQYKAFPLK